MQLFKISILKTLDYLDGNLYTDQSKWQKCDGQGRIKRNSRKEKAFFKFNWNKCFTLNYRIGYKYSVKNHLSESYLKSKSKKTNKQTVVNTSHARNCINSLTYQVEADRHRSIYQRLLMSRYYFWKHNHLGSFYMCVSNIDEGIR